MDETQIRNFAQKCKLLKFKCKGVFAADNFPILQRNSFLIVNASISSSIGTHWLLICNRDDFIIFADPLGVSLNFYKMVFKRTLGQYIKIHELNIKIQPFNSNSCGLYCLYIAHSIFSNFYPLVPHITENDLYRFVNHMQ